MNPQIHSSKLLPLVVILTVLCDDLNCQGPAEWHQYKVKVFTTRYTLRNVLFERIRRWILKKAFEPTEVLTTALENDTEAVKQILQTLARHRIISENSQTA